MERWIGFGLVWIITLAYLDYWVERLGSFWRHDLVLLRLRTLTNERFSSYFSKITVFI